MKKGICKVLAGILAMAMLGGCGSSNEGATGAAEAAATAAVTATEAPTTAAATTAASASKENVTILVAAAASLEYSYTEKLIPMFQEKYDWITVEGTYDSSGKLQTQIEEGLAADVFMSAAAKQMTALKDENLIDAGSIVDLLENKIVVIVPADKKDGITTFEQIADVETVALGDPESVPAGQYAKEALTKLNLWDAVSAKTSFGTNVTEVLNWVAEGSADAGIVYATDAATTDKVAVVAEAPEGSLEKKVIYPVGMTAASEHSEEAKLFIEFLQSEEAMAVFEEYGFSAYK